MLGDSGRRSIISVAMVSGIIVWFLCGLRHFIGMVVGWGGIVMAMVYVSRM